MEIIKEIAKYLIESELYEAPEKKEEEKEEMPDPNIVPFGKEYKGKNLEDVISTRDGYDFLTKTLKNSLEKIKDSNPELFAKHEPFYNNMISSLKGKERPTAEKRIARKAGMITHGDFAGKKVDDLTFDQLMKAHKKLNKILSGYSAEKKVKQPDYPDMSHTFKEITKYLKDNDMIEMRGNKWLYADERTRRETAKRLGTEGEEKMVNAEFVGVHEGVSKLKQVPYIRLSFVTDDGIEFSVFADRSNREFVSEFVYEKKFNVPGKDIVDTKIAVKPQTRNYMYEIKGTVGVDEERGYNSMDEPELLDKQVKSIEDIGSAEGDFESGAARAVSDFMKIKGKDAPEAEKSKAGRKALKNPFPESKFIGSNGKTSSHKFQLLNKTTAKNKFGDQAVMILKQYGTPNIAMYVAPPAEPKLKRFENIGDIYEIEAKMMHDREGKSNVTKLVEPFIEKITSAEEFGQQKGKEEFIKMIKPEEEINEHVKKIMNKIKYIGY